MCSHALAKSRNLPSGRVKNRARAQTSPAEKSPGILALAAHYSTPHATYIYAHVSGDESRIPRKVRLAARAVQADAKPDKPRGDSPRASAAGNFLA